MKNCRIILLVILLSPKFLLAQIYSGMVIDNDSKEPLVNANIFLAGTLTGTTTNKDGYFELDANGNTSVPLVVSFVGYVTSVFSFFELTSNSVIKLKKEVLEIDEIIVKSNPSGWSRIRMMQVFKEEFLGSSFNAQSCKIENEKDIYLFYNSTTETLYANSLNPLVIENKLLNYKITYVLESFQKSDSGVKFKGYSSFKELPFKNEKHKKRVIEQRVETYLGSIMHFMRYLYKDNIYDKDTIYDIDVISSIYAYNNYDASSLSENYFGDLHSTVKMSKNEINNIVIRKYQDLFQLYDSLENYISNSKILSDTLEVRRLYADQEIRILYLGNLSNSYLVPNSGCIEIAKNGYYDPDLISWYGFMSKFRIGDLLPYDYVYKLYEPIKKRYLFE